MACRRASPRAAAYQFANQADLGPLRLASFLALAIVIVGTVPRTAAWLEGRAAGAVVLCGQHSLQVFCLGIFLSVTAHSLLLEFGYSIRDAGAGDVRRLSLALGSRAVLSWSERKAVRRRDSAGTGRGMKMRSRPALSTFVMAILLLAGAPSARAQPPDPGEMPKACRVPLTVFVDEAKLPHAAKRVATDRRLVVVALGSSSTLGSGPARRRPPGRSGSRLTCAADFRDSM